MYSFDADDSAAAIARWNYKGVQALPYTKTNEHRALWDSLRCWAARADDPSSWRRDIANLARVGPDKLQPHQRGQVAHLVSTYEGVRDFSECAPPAEWLCTFDPLCRYAGSGRSDYFDPQSSLIDPFAIYGLDSDATPERSALNSASAMQSPPLDAWDAFAMNSADRQEITDEHLPAVRGWHAMNVARLPKRLACLSAWIARGACQPATVWWAVRQQHLHPAIRNGVARQIERQHEDVHHLIVKSWRYLLEARERTEDEPWRQWHDLRRETDRAGWTAAALRQFAVATRPHLKADRALISKPTPPQLDEGLRIWDLIRFAVEFPVPSHDIDVPDQWLDRAIRELRKNIEFAVQLCDEVGDTSPFHVSPIVPDMRPDISSFGRTHGLSGCVIEFASLFERLVELDPAKAKSEVSAWPTDDDTVFSRLRLWASAKPAIADPGQFGEVVNGLSDAAFWSHDHQRDLLVLLIGCWHNFPDQSRKQIEARLLDGPPRWASELDDMYNKRRAWATLERLQWLASHGCTFSFDLETAIAERRKAAPEWRPDYASHAAESREPRGGFIQTNTEYAELMHKPIGHILPLAQELSGRTTGNMLEERDPFAGLCANRPVHAFRALTHAARRGLYPEWAWRTFLSSPQRDSDKARLLATIAEIVCRFPDDTLIRLLYPSTSWLQKAGKSPSNGHPRVFDRLTIRIVDLLQRYVSDGGSTIVATNRGRDWVTEALNSSAGHIALVILDDSRLERIDLGDGLPANSLDQLSRLLTLKGNGRRHVIAITSHHLDWLYHLDPEWTEAHLLSALDANDAEDRDALLAGVFWNPNIRRPQLYQRLKPLLLALAKRASAHATHLQALAHLTLVGWIEISAKGKARLVSNVEFRDALLHGGDGFRSHILWQIQRGLSANDESSREEWLAWALEFFEKVWPRERASKTPAMSARLCEMLLTNAESFRVLVDAVFPFLTKITRSADVHWHLRNDATDVIDKHPERLLKLLHTVLPEEPSGWPYGVGDMLDKLSGADDALGSDARLKELKRRWGAR